MHWVKPFFDAAARLWGEPEIRDADRARAASIERYCGPGRKRVLELGAGGGTTAAAIADLGHHVTAVEVSSVRAAYARAFADADPARDMVVVECDFYDLHVEEPYDCVAYFNGFGIGTDADQRRLLRLARDAWLAPAGCMVLDLFSPAWWVLRAGQLRHLRHGIELVNHRDYDAHASRFLDRWWPLDAPDQAITQSARCYSPADLALLLEGTGLRVARAEVEGAEIDLASDGVADPRVWSASVYQVQLVRETGGT